MRSVSALRAEPVRALPPRPESRTLLDLVRAVSEVTSDEDEVVATVLHMLRSGSVRLCGNFRNEPIENFGA